MYTVNRLLNHNLDLDESFIETCARIANKILLFWRLFVYFLMSLIPWLSHIHYVYIESPITSRIRWKVFFAETILRHYTVQILKAFIFMQYMACNKYYLISYVCTISAVQKFKFFVFVDIGQLHAKITCIQAQYHKKI